MRFYLHEVCTYQEMRYCQELCLYAGKGAAFGSILLFWISLKTIKEDMEFACDQRVLKHMKPGQEVKYCEALLHTTRFMKAKKGSSTCYVAM